MKEEERKQSIYHLIPFNPPPLLSSPPSLTPIPPRTAPPAAFPPPRRVVGMFLPAGSRVDAGNTVVIACLGSVLQAARVAAIAVKY